VPQIDLRSRWRRRPRGRPVLDRAVVRAARIGHDARRLREVRRARDVRNDAAGAQRADGGRQELGLKDASAGTSRVACANALRAAPQGAEPRARRVDEDAVVPPAPARVRPSSSDTGTSSGTPRRSRARGRRVRGQLVGLEGRRVESLCGEHARSATRGGAQVEPALAGATGTARARARAANCEPRPARGRAPDAATTARVAAGGAEPDRRVRRRRRVGRTLGESRAERRASRRRGVVGVEEARARLRALGGQRDGTRGSPTQGGRSAPRRSSSERAAAARRSPLLRRALEMRRSTALANPDAGSRLAHLSNGLVHGGV
jgi:hypothetical protein